MKGLLPRHMQLLTKLIHALKRWWKKPGRARKSVGQTGGGTRQTSAYGEPCVVGGFAVNGVAALHSDLVVKICSRNITSYGRTNSITSPRYYPTSLDQTVQPGTGGSVGKSLKKEWANDLDQLINLEKLLMMRNSVSNIARSSRRIKSAGRVCESSYRY